MQKFDTEDFEDPGLRVFTEEQRQTSKMKKVLFNQQLDIQMRCDFIARNSSKDTNSSIEEAKDSEHPMSKYKQMTSQF